MFVKVVRKNEKGVYYTSLFECEAAHYSPNDNEKQATVHMEPSSITIDVEYDENGESNIDIYYMNSDGKTIDKVV